MYLPTRMTRVVAGGHRQHLEPFLRALQDEGVVHLEDFADPTGTTGIGTPLEEGDALSAQLVRVRGILRSMGAEGTAPGRLEQRPEEVLREAEQEVLPVLDRIAEVRARLAAAESEAAALAPYQDLDVELSAVHGLRSVQVHLGTVREDPSRGLESIGGEARVAERQGRKVLVAVVPVAEAAEAERILANAGFSSASLPEDSAGTPAERLAQLRSQQEGLRGSLTELEQRSEDLRELWGPTLAAVERHLATEVDRTQAPLRFGVTETTFHAEGWIPRASSGPLRDAVAHACGEGVYFEDLGDVPRTHEEPGGAHGAHGARDQTEEHHDPDPEDEAPVRLENRGLAVPFEFLLGLLGRPRYKEIDPTTLMLIFFPLFFGLMVGDVIVGLVIMAFGLYLKNHAVFGIGGPSVGRVLTMGGFMAVVIGAFVFGEALGIHFVVSDEAWEEGEPSWEKILGADWSDNRFLTKVTEDHGPGHEVGGEAAQEPPEGALADAPHGEGTGGASVFSLKPHGTTHLSVNGWFNLGYYSKIHDVTALLVWSVLIGITHLALGFLIGVRNVYVSHGAALAVQEKAAWLLVMASVPVAVIGWMQASTPLLALGAAAFVLAVGLLWIGAAKVIGAGFIALLEVPGLVGNILSYTRITAIGASKAGMALAFMQIGFVIMGGGDFHSAVGWMVYIIGMAAITLLAILSGGLQSLRLQFVEFFQKFYAGGGRPYVPFDRRAP